MERQTLEQGISIDEGGRLGPSTMTTRSEAATQAQPLASHAATSVDDHRVDLPA
jgi:hypothetical protein